jgi:hypothetical protein
MDIALAVPSQNPAVSGGVPFALIGLQQEGNI